MKGALHPQTRPRAARGYHPCALRGHGHMRCNGAATVSASQQRPGHAPLCMRQNLYTCGPQWGHHVYDLPFFDPAALRRHAKPVIHPTNLTLLQSSTVSALLV